MQLVGGEEFLVGTDALVAEGGMIGGTSNATKGCKQ
jgi:hypothetical protein